MSFKEQLVSENISILEALKVLDNTSRRVLFVIRDNKLVGAISDGDIRRWILKNGSLNDPISSTVNYNPKFIFVDQRENYKSYMLQRHLDALPVVDHDMEVKDVIFLYDEAVEDKYEQINVPVVLMAGGKGTRLYPYTKILPKPLIPIGDIPISEHIVNRFHEYGCDDFYFIVNYKKNMIKAYFNEIEHDYKVSFIDEDVPLGTGGGISLLKGKITSTFILTNCDSIINEDFSKILKEHKDKKNLVTMICSLRNYEVPYGVVEIGENGSIQSMTEKPSMSFFTNTGTYIVEPEVIDEVEEGQSIGFPDVIQKLKDQGRNVGVYPINESDWLDMGQFDTMENMKQKLKIKD